MPENPVSCSSCPGSNTRDVCDLEKLEALDVFLARYTFDTDPTFDFTPSDDLQDALLDKYGLPLKDVEPLFLCARKRYLGMCSISFVDVDIKSDVL